MPSPIALKAIDAIREELSTHPDLDANREDAAELIDREMCADTVFLKWLERVAPETVQAWRAQYARKQADGTA